MRTFIYTFILLLATSTSIYSQACDEAVSCFAFVNISMSASCNALIIAEDMLSDVCPERTYEVRLEDEFGNALDNPLDASYIGTTVHFFVKDLTLDVECWGEITLEDNTPPFIDFVGGPAVLSCQDNFEELIVVGTFDNCGESWAQLTDISIRCKPCEYDSVFLTYYLEDEYGNSAEEIKGFEFVDFCLEVEFPENVEVSCPQEVEDVTGYIAVTDTDVCPTDLTINFSDITFGCDVTRVWTITEECSGRFISHSQLINVADDDAPKLTVPEVEGTITIQEINDGYCPPFTVEEACPESFNFTVKGVKEVFSCNPTEYQMLYTISSIDACGFVSDPIDRLVTVVAEGPSQVKIKGTKSCRGDFILDAKIKNLVEPVTYTWSATNFAWGVTPIGTGESATISPANGTTYIQVTAVDALGCEVSASRKIICKNFSIGERGDSSFSIYPNPVNDYINIESNLEIYSIEVYAIDGIIVESIKPEGGLDQRIYMQNYVPGVYYLKIRTVEGILTEKIIKN